MINYLLQALAFATGYALHAYIHRRMRLAALEAVRQTQRRAGAADDAYMRGYLDGRQITPGLHIEDIPTTLDIGEALRTQGKVAWRGSKKDLDRLCDIK